MSRRKERPLSTKGDAAKILADLNVKLARHLAAIPEPGSFDALMFERRELTIREAIAAWEHQLSLHS